MKFTPILLIFFMCLVLVSANTCLIQSPEYSTIPVNHSFNFVYKVQDQASGVPISSLSCVLSLYDNNGYLILSNTSSYASNVYYAELNESYFQNYSDNTKGPRTSEPIRNNPFLNTIYNFNLYYCFPIPLFTRRTYFA
jgi:hypothetical protein